jgi:hypothetical protein
MIRLRSLLNEKSTDPNSVKSVFGKVVFGDPRNTVGSSFMPNQFLKLQQAKEPELNTDIENKILTYLFRWTRDGDVSSVKVLNSYFQLFKKAAKKFPSIFKPDTENGTVLYRGIGNSPISSKGTPSKVKNTILKSDIDDYEKIRFGSESWLKYKKPVKLIPHRMIQSWTSSFKISRGFYSSYAESYPNIGCILMTKQNDEFLMSQKTLSIIGGYKEKEILHFGKEYNEDIFLLISRKDFDAIKKNPFPKKVK